MDYKICKNDIFLSNPIFLNNYENIILRKIIWVFFLSDARAANLPDMLWPATEKIVRQISLVYTQFVAVSVIITNVFDNVE